MAMMTALHSAVNDDAYARIDLHAPSLNTRKECVRESLLSLYEYRFHFVILSVVSRFNRCVCVS